MTEQRLNAWVEGTVRRETDGWATLDITQFWSDSDGEAEDESEHSIHGSVDNLRAMLTELLAELDRVDPHPPRRVSPRQTAEHIALWMTIMQRAMKGDYDAAYGFPQDGLAGYVDMLLDRMADWHDDVKSYG